MIWSLKRDSLFLFFLLTNIGNANTARFGHGHNGFT